METDLACSLPRDYREFLQDYGGFVFGRAEFSIQPNADGVSASGLDSFIGFHPDEFRSGDDYYCGLLSMGEMWDVETTSGVRLVKPVSEGASIAWPRELLPVAVNAGGSWICLALAGLRPGATFFWVNSGNYGQNVYVIADSFDDFMQSLYLRE